MVATSNAIRMALCCKAHVFAHQLRPEGYLTAPFSFGTLATMSGVCRDAEAVKWGPPTRHVLFCSGLAGVGPRLSPVIACCYESVAKCCKAVVGYSPSVVAAAQDFLATRFFSTSSGSESYPMARLPDQLSPMRMPSFVRPGNHRSRHSSRGTATTEKPRYAVTLEITPSARDCFDQNGIDRRPSELIGAGKPSESSIAHTVQFARTSR